MNTNATKWKRTFNSDKTSMSVELYWEVNSNFYIRAIDKNGNASDSSDVFNVKIDTTNPTCNISASPTTTTSGSVVLTINGSDSRSGVKDYSWTSASSGFASTKTKTVSANGTYSAWIRDNAGKVGTCNYSVSNISKRPATPTIYNPSGGNWTNQSITLTVKTTTPASEIGYWYYSYDNANFVRYDNSSYNSYGLNTFNTSPYSAERNQPAYIRVCNKSASSATDTNNCSDSASTYIRIDKSMYTPALREIHNVSSYSCDWNNGYTTGTKHCYINISVYSMNSWWFETTDYDNGVGYQSWGAWFLGNNCNYIGGNPWGQWIWDSDGFFSVDGCSSEHYAIKNRDRLGNESSELQLHITILY